LPTYIKRKDHNFPKSDFTKQLLLALSSRSIICKHEQKEISLNGLISGISLVGIIGLSLISHYGLVGFIGLGFSFIGLGVNSIGLGISLIGLGGHNGNISLIRLDFVLSACWLIDFTGLKASSASLASVASTALLGKLVSLALSASVALASSASLASALLVLLATSDLPGLSVTSAS
jgi:hypothetical protein